jgi:hypothetical protein
MPAKRVPRGDGCSVNGMVQVQVQVQVQDARRWDVFRWMALAACSSRVADVL